MHQHGALCPRAQRPSAVAGLQHLHFCDVVSGRARAARFRPARQWRARMARAVSSPDITVRLATDDDVALQFRFVWELAVLARSRDAALETDDDPPHAAF